MFTTHFSSAVVDPPVISSDGRLRPGLHVRPRALVLVLFLHKHQLGVRVLIALLLPKVERERADLFQASDGNLVFEAWNLRLNKYMK
jgi:hypothetical protein